MQTMFAFLSQPYARCSVFIFALQKCNTRTTSVSFIHFLQSKKMDKEKRKSSIYDCKAIINKTLRQ